MGEIGHLLKILIKCWWLNDNLIFYHINYSENAEILQNFEFPKIIEKFPKHPKLLNTIGL